MEILLISDNHRSPLRNSHIQFQHDIIILQRVSEKERERWFEPPVTEIIDVRAAIQ
jgi:hypothetical protein